MMPIVASKTENPVDISPLENLDMFPRLDELRLGLLEHHLIADFAGLIADAADQLAEIGIAKTMPESRQQYRKNPGVPAGKALGQPIGAIAGLVNHLLDAQMGCSADARIVIQNHRNRGDRHLG